MSTCFRCYRKDPTVVSRFMDIFNSLLMRPIHICENIKLCGHNSGPNIEI